MNKLTGNNGLRLIRNHGALFSFFGWAQDVALIATAGGVSATIKPNRPSWADMKLHYPDKTVTTATLYNEKIRGSFTNLDTVPTWENTCAIRMSYALLRSGFNLHRIKGSMLGADKRSYWFRVLPLRAELIKRFKGFDAELKFDLLTEAMSDYRSKLDQARAARKRQAQKFIDENLKGRQGIILFKVQGWRDSAGHFTLWDGKKNELAYAKDHDDPADNEEYYFWMTSKYPGGLGFLQQVTHVQFWELK